MKKYEYKFVKLNSDFELSAEKKMKKLEEEWNKLGSEGWKFCTQFDNMAVFRKKFKEEKE